VKTPECKGKKPYEKWRLDIPSLESIAEPLSQLFFGGIVDPSFVRYDWVQNYADIAFGWTLILSKQGGGNEQHKGCIKIVSIMRWDGLRVPRKRRTYYMI
jgi:hypothetical protein